MATNILTGGIASSDSKYAFSPNYNAEKAIDGNTGTWWNTDSRLPYPHWWKYDLGISISKTVTRLRIIVNHGDIKDFKLQGSNNDSSWTDLYTGVQADNNNWQEYTFANSTAYRYYRVVISSNYFSDTNALINEVEMYEADYLPSPFPTFHRV